jgi:hypothetical protein
VQAAANARNEIIRVAGNLLECPGDDVGVAEGQATVRGRGGQSIFYTEIAVKAAGQGDPVSGFAEFKSGSPDITRLHDLPATAKKVYRGLNGR